MTDALALASGISADGADTVTLVRTQDGKTEYRDIDVVALFKPGGEASNELVQDGDVINVSRQPMFYIYGEVQRPGSFRLEQNMSVVQALSMGGGLNSRGTQRGIMILRRDANGDTAGTGRRTGRPGQKRRRDLRQGKPVLRDTHHELHPISADPERAQVDHPWRAAAHRCGHRRGEPVAAQGIHRHHHADHRFQEQGPVHRPVAAVADVSRLHGHADRRHQEQPGGEQGGARPEAGGQPRHPRAVHGSHRRQGRRSSSGWATCC